jgi:hypothetical protein
MGYRLFFAPFAALKKPSFHANWRLMHEYQFGFWASCLAKASHRYPLDYKLIYCLIEGPTPNFSQPFNSIDQLGGQTFVIWWHAALHKAFKRR